MRTGYAKDGFVVEDDEEEDVCTETAFAGTLCGDLHAGANIQPDPDDLVRIDVDMSSLQDDAGTAQACAAEDVDDFNEPGQPADLRTKEERRRHAFAREHLNQCSNTVLRSYMKDILEVSTCCYEATGELTATGRPRRRRRELSREQILAQLRHNLEEDEDGALYQHILNAHYFVHSVTSDTAAKRTIQSDVCASSILTGRSKRTAAVAAKRKIDAVVDALGDYRPRKRRNANGSSCGPASGNTAELDRDVADYADNTDSRGVDEDDDGDDVDDDDDDDDDEDEDEDEDDGDEDGDEDYADDGAEAYADDDDDCDSISDEEPDDMYGAPRYQS